MAHNTGHSEFYNLTLGSKSVPLDLAGAKQVAFVVTGADRIYVSHSNTQNTNEAFLLPITMFGDPAVNNVDSPPFVINCRDDRLWLWASQGSSAQVFVWVVR